MPPRKAALEGLILLALFMNHIEENIRGYIASSFLDNGHATGDGLSSEDDLLTILDSLQILRMLMDLESQYAIKIENSELTPENLGTIQRLAAFIDRKQQTAACQGPVS